MGSTSLFLVVLIPLLVFAVVDTFASLKVALIAAAVAALGEVAFSYFYLGEIDSFSMASVFLVFLMGGVAYLKESRQIFYLKPAILSFALGAFLVGAHMMGHSVLLEGVTKYAQLFPPEQQEVLAQPMLVKILTNASFTVGISLILHGLFTAWAAYRLSRWGWLAVAAVGVYFFMFAGLVAAAL
ncbi:MAG: septation protein IspZ [Bdellovibrionales bacterium]|nr:septation protein IspZ [Bdellovibrionales bacterium]MCB0411060.1 septation protein IspZ [Bdellovibrionales bacterium]USN47563.1 MAG: septation protein IspZ [Pseudobdellovibrionaceae bacterium]